MEKKNKSLLGVITLACLTLIAGTFAWTSFNQRALNENNGTRTEGYAKGRVHDDYNKKTGNKDVYAENYGKEDLVVRMRLSEYFEADGTPLVSGTKKDDFKTWTPYVQPETAPSSSYREYVSWTLGGKKVFLPTFNTNAMSESVDVTGDGIDRDTNTTGTAPGAGNQNDFTVGQVVANPNDPSSTHTAKNTVTQKNAPITMAAWKALSAADKKGDYWVIDTDGWAYWANALKPSEATSLLLDQITIDQTKVGQFDDWYYGIDVQGQFATLDDTNDFDNNGGITEDGKDIIENIIDDKTKPTETFTYDLNFTSDVSKVEMDAGTNQTFGAKLEKTSSLTGQTTDVPTTFTWSVEGGSAGTSISPAGVLTVGAADAGKSLKVIVATTTPALSKSFTVTVKKKSLLPQDIKPGGDFKFNDEDYIYLKGLGEGNHLILRKHSLNTKVETKLNYNDSMLNVEMKEYYSSLSEESKKAVQPVQITFDHAEGGELSSDCFLIENAPYEVTKVTPNGEKKAFALSAEELNEVSGPGKAFPSVYERVSDSVWYLRTTWNSYGSNTGVWAVQDDGQVFVSPHDFEFGIRPALIIHE